jgi:hypothetical protein
MVTCRDPDFGIYCPNRLSLNGQPFKLAERASSPVFEAKPTNSTIFDIKNIIISIR